MFLEYVDKHSGDRILINLKPKAISITINTYTVLTFDLLGRPLIAFVGGHTFLRSLDNRVLEKWRVKREDASERVRMWLSLEERRAFLDDLNARMRAIYDNFRAGELEVRRQSKPIRRELFLRALERIIRYDFQTLEGEREKFERIYSRVGILPPDKYLALVLQATEGCSYNKCSFCNFYRRIPYRVKSPQEFRRHIEEVIDFFGEALALRKSIFLGEANALAVPMPRLLPLLEEIHRYFRLGNAKPGSNGSPWAKTGFDGIYSFLDVFTGKLKTIKDFETLREAGLRRVYLGIETGDDELLRFLNKPGTAADAERVVWNLKEAGLNVGVIFLLGAGGDIFYRSHVARTASLLRRLPLGKGDLIYFSELVSWPEVPYASEVRLRRIRDLDSREMQRQKKEILARAGLDRTSTVKVSSYCLSEFIY